MRREVMRRSNEVYGGVGDQILSSWLTSSCQQITWVIMHRWLREERSKKQSGGIVTISHVAPLSHLAEWNAEARGAAARSQKLAGRCGDLKV